METKVCNSCGGSFKNMGVHTRFCKGVGGASLSSTPPAPGPPPKRVRFVSPRALGLRVVIRGDRWARVTTPSGVVQEIVPGKSVEFTDGHLDTDDPEVIAYLTDHYKDPRFPVVAVPGVHSVQGRNP